jgi:thiol-disulfide isomerase/thioredoxin
VRLTLLTRSYCHLCDEMLEALAPIAAAHGAPVAVVDVDTDPALEAAYGELVPVLLAGDPGTAREVCHYRLDRPRVVALLAAAATAGA